MSEIAACTLIQEELDRKTERYMMSSRITRMWYP